MKGKERINIAIDGPSGAGKSTLAKMIAKEFGFKYVDTGAIYRTVGLYVLRAGAQPRDEAEVSGLLPRIDIGIKYDEDGFQRMLLCGEDVSGEIRLPEASKYASDVSALPPVRAFLLEMQRKLAREYDVVMDGRDIGTVVIPNASVKIFLTASPEVRAERRYKELLEKGISCTYEDVCSDMLQRDKNDSERAISPLRPAEDSVLIDTTDIDLEQSFKKLAELIEAKVRNRNEDGL